MFAYILKVSLCWLVFYLVYVAFLSKETFFRTNRWYLLGTLLLGAGIPLLEFLPIFQENHLAVVYIQPLSDGLQYVQVSVNEVVTESMFDWAQLFWWIYLGGVSVCISRFLFGLNKIFSLYKRSEILPKKNYTLVLTNEIHLPFSFFNYLFWSKNLPFDDADGQKIITHEEAHVSGWHSVDVLLVEILSILFWCSPMVYFYKKSLKAVHEFLADAVVLQTTQTKQYGHLLLRQSQPGLQVALANHFFHSQLKQRIVMMTKNKSSRQALAKYFFALPVFLLLFLLFSKKEVTAQNTSDGQNENLETVMVVAYPIDNHEYTNDDFDRKKIKKQLGGILYPYQNKESDDDRQKVLREFKMALGDFMIKYPDHKSELIEISNELMVEMKISKMSTEKTVSSAKGDVFKVVEEMPRFPGCEEIVDQAERNKCAQTEMLKFIYTNIKYPKAARSSDIQGKVILQFVVQKDGTVADTKIVRDIGGGCGEESLRVVNSMPKWIPGKQKGKAVNVVYTLPVQFKLEGDSKDNKIDLKTDIGSTEPLFVLDGKILGPAKDRVEKLNPEEIESVHVLKGEKALEKYGDEGKNGVIEVVTKKKFQQKEDLQPQDEIFKVVDEMPRFPGCEEMEDEMDRKKCAEQEMLKFIYSNIKYPKEAAKECIQGKVIVQFVIDAEGKVTQAQLLRGIGGGCDEETLRVVNSMPKWTPGKQRGEKVNVQYVLPVQFRVDCDEEKVAAPAEHRHPVDKSKELEKAGFTYLRISPNPTDGLIDIEYGSRDEQMTVTGKDITGKEIFRRNVPGGKSSIRNLNVKDAAKGVILITFQQGGNIYTEKVILQ